MFKILGKRGVGRRNGKSLRKTRRVVKKDSRVVPPNIIEEDEYEDIEEVVGNSPTKTEIAYSNASDIITGVKQIQLGAASNMEDKWPEFEDEVPPDIISPVSIFPASFIIFETNERGKREFSINVMRTQECVLVESFVLPTRAHLGPGIMLIKAAISVLPASNLKLLAFHGVIFKTVELIEIMKFVPQLECLMLVGCSWNDADENYYNCPAMPGMPKLHSLIIYHHWVQEEYPFPINFKYAIRRIVKPYFTQLSRLRVDGRISFYDKADRQAVHGQLEEFDVIVFKLSHFVKSPLINAPLRKLTINAILVETETSVQDVWKFLEKFAGTLCDLRVDSPFIWQNNENDSFHPIVPFPYVNKLSINPPKVEDYELLFHNRIIPRFPLLKLSLIHDCSNLVRLTG